MTEYVPRECGWWTRWFPLAFECLGRELESARVVCSASTLMSGDHGLGVQRLDGIERPDPFLSLFSIRLGEVQVDVVVGGVPGDHQADRRDVQNGRVVGVGVADLNGNQLVALE